MEEVAGVGRGGRGAYAAPKITLSHIKRLNQTESPIFCDLMCSLFPKAILFGFYFTLL